jgi:excisionase family DNA binding protein
MTENTLPRIFTLGEVAEYLKVSEDIILHEFAVGNLHGFMIGKEWRCSEEDILNYIERDRAKPEIAYSQPRQTKAQVYDRDWNIVDSEPFDFNWPKTGGGGYPEHYDKAYEATTTIEGQEYTFKIGFGNRESAGQERRRVTIWLGNRAVVEFAGSNDYENEGLLAGIIRLRNGKQLTTQRIPDEYRGFRVERYNSVVKGPRASTGMAVIVHKDDLKSMLNHAVIRATWKQLF